MPEEISFARKASGLTRGLSTYDAMGIGLMVVQPIAGIWGMLYIGAGLYPGGNMIIAIVISIFACGITSALVWGMLGGSMPRSGGEYVFNSRIINPIIATGASAAQLIAIIYWNFFIVTWFASPSMSMLAEFMGWTSFSNWIASKSGTFVLCAICIVGSYLTIVFGMRVYKTIQKPLIILALLGPAVIAVALTVTTKADFIGHWNALAAQYHSLTYQSFTAAAGTARGTMFPHTWTWGATIGAMDGAFLLFVYNYFIVYVGGEVKRPDRALLSANVLAVFIPAFLGLWTVIGLYRIMSFSFFGATQWVTLGGGTLKGYNFPYPPSYMTLGWIASHGNWFVAVIACVSFLVVTYLEVTLTFLGFSRILFAWGMDRMGPKWFTDISPRWAGPIKTYTLAFAILFIGTAAYVLWFTTLFTGLAAAGMQLVSVFFVTGVSAVIFPYRKRVRTIWESSPYRRFHILGVPVLTIAGVIYLGYILVLLYFAFIDSATRDVTGKNMISFVVAWIVGIAWFLWWRRQNSKVGIDVGITYGQLPPD